ncbi:MAG: hypothetical protein QXD23_03330 [Candidatus Micrarchaeaceae archaeon]
MSKNNKFNKFKSDRKEGHNFKNNFKNRDARQFESKRNTYTSKEDRRNKFMRKAKGEVMMAYKATATDHSIIEAVKSYNELEKIRNIIYERLEEWYGAYFPNLKLNNHETYAKIITKINTKIINEDKLKEILGEEYEKILNLIKSSEGFPEIDTEEYKAMKALAEQELLIIKLQNEIDSFLEIQTKKLMPNIVYLIDYKIAAEMLSMAGSLEHLAIMPASTIQLLGAENALFKHIKFGSRPPKYGYLFKLPELAMLSKKDKGRKARAYATKISIAARADYYTKRFIADKLKESLLQKKEKN